MGVRGDRPVSETMADGCQGLASPDDSGANAQGTGALVRHLTAGTGLHSSSDGRSAGTGPTHHRAMGVGLRRGRACSLDVRADRGFPLALGETQQADLRAAVQEFPEHAGIELANWYWRVVRQFVLERFGIELSRSSCLTPYRVRGDVTICTGWDSS